MKNDITKLRVRMEAEPAPAPAPADPFKDIMDAINSGLASLQGGATQAGQVVESAAAPLDQGTSMLGQAQDMINDPISGIINGVTRTANQLLSVTGPQPYLEEDPTGIVEGITEGLNVVGDGLAALNVNIQNFLKLDPTVARELIKVGEAGDRVCDASRGEVRMTVEFPFNGGFRQFNLCLDAKTAKNVVKQIGTEPMKPVLNAVECGLSEMLLKPVNHFVTDVKNVGATIVRFGMKPADIMGNAKEVIQGAVDGIQKFWAGSYGIWLNPDSLSCFQAKTNGIEFETVDLGRLATDAMDTRFLRGEKTQAPFSRKEKRVCRV